MKKLFLLIIFLFLSLQVKADSWIKTSYGYSCSGTCQAVTVRDFQYGYGYIDRKLPAFSAPAKQEGCGYCGKSYNDKIESSHNFNKPRIFQALCSAESEQNTSNLERKTSSEYWATYDGGLVNDESLREFFSIIKNQYSADCDEWFSQYIKLPFHKTLIFAYDKNINDVNGYWALSLSTYHRNEAEQFGIQACENSHKSLNFESFNCAVLFTNNQIMNKEYLALAKMSNEEYKEAITNYENKISEVRVSQSELGDFFK